MRSAEARSVGERVPTPPPPVACIDRLDHDTSRMPGNLVAVPTGDSPRRGTRGQRLTAAKKVERDRAIVIDRNRGFTWEVVAQRNGLGERQCRAIYSARREPDAGGLPGLDPMEWFLNATTAGWIAWIKRPIPTSTRWLPGAATPRPCTTRNRSRGGRRRSRSCSTRTLSIPRFPPLPRP